MGRIGTLQGLPPVEHPPGRPLVLAVAGLRRIWSDVSPPVRGDKRCSNVAPAVDRSTGRRSEEHTSELQSRQYLVCRLLLEKKKTTYELHMLSLTQTIL